MVGWLVENRTGSGLDPCGMNRDSKLHSGRADDHRSRIDDRSRGFDRRAEDFSRDRRQVVPRERERERSRESRLYPSSNARESEFSRSYQDRDPAPSRRLQVKRYFFTVRLISASFQFLLSGDFQSNGGKSLIFCVITSACEREI